MAENGDKRARIEQKVPDWILKFDDVSSFKFIVESAAPIMSRALFTIKKNSETGVYFLHLDGSDMAMSCILSAKLELENVFFSGEEADEFSFCVSSKHLLIPLRGNASMCSSVDVEGYVKDATIRVKVIHDPEYGASEEDSKFNTYVDGIPRTLNLLHYEHVIELDVSRIKDHLKKARDSKSEKLKITVYLKENGPTKQSVTTFTTIDGDSQEHTLKFCATVAILEDGSMVIRAASDGQQKIFDYESLTPTFEGIFQVDKIDNFIKYVPSKMLKCKVSNGKPMLMIQNLKGETNEDSSRVYFLVAPMTDDE